MSRAAGLGAATARGTAVPPARTVRGASTVPAAVPVRPTRRRRDLRPRRARPGSSAELADLVAAVTGVAVALRSGALPAEAWRRAGVRAPLGVPPREELARRWPGQVGAVTTLVAAAELTATLGVAPATVLDRVAVTLARDAEAAGQRQAALAGPLATARLLGWLPVVGLGLGFALGADPLGVLLDGGAGSALLLVGAALLLAGRRWTARHVADAREAADG